MLQDENGAWITEMGQLEKHVTEYYKKLFHDDEQFWSLGLTGMFPLINGRDMQSLERNGFLVKKFFRQ